MKVYFLSRHEISELMIQHLRKKLALPDDELLEIVHVKGTISNIKKDESSIGFTEIYEIQNEDGSKSQVADSVLIGIGSIIIAVCPVTMQIDWLKAGANLLIPQTTKIPVGETDAEFVYTGLLHIKKIAVESEQWAGEPRSVEQVLEQRKLLAQK